jgi:hypothetical protein
VPRHGPALQHVVRCGLQDFEASCAREPRLELLGLQDHGHAVVQLAHELVGVRHDHCARSDGLICLSISPFIPEARNGDRRAVASREIVRLLAVRRIVPLVVARRGDQAARVQGLTERWLLCDRLERALKVASFISLSGLVHQEGMRPQRIGTSARAPIRPITVSIFVVGQVL